MSEEKESSRRTLKIREKASMQDEISNIVLPKAKVQGSTVARKEAKPSVHRAKITGFSALGIFQSLSVKVGCLVLAKLVRVGGWQTQLVLSHDLLFIPCPR